MLRQILFVLVVLSIVMTACGGDAQQPVIVEDTAQPIQPSVENVAIQPTAQSQSATSPTCQNEPRIGMRFVWNELQLASNIGVRAWPTAETALMNLDSGYVEIAGEMIQQSGSIDTLAWDFPSAIMATDFTHLYQVIDGPVCNGSQCAWLVTLLNGEIGWTLWNNDFCEWEYSQVPNWKAGDSLVVQANPFNNLPIFFGDPVPGTPVDTLPNGTIVSVIQGPVINGQWYSQWFDLQSVIAPGPNAHGYRWWLVRLENGSQGYVPEGLPMDNPWLANSAVPQQFVGADEPWSITYLRVPAPVALDSIAVYEQPIDGSSVLGYLEPLRYYEYVATQQSSNWLQVRNPYGLNGWIDLRQSRNLIRVGNLQQSTLAELPVDQIIEQASVATITTVADLEPEQLQALQTILNQEQLQLVVPMTEAVGVIVQYFRTGKAGSLTDAVCLPVSILTGESLSTQTADSICLFIGLGSANPYFAWASITADPSRYIDSWYIPLQTQILDRTSGSCLFAKYFVPGGGGERCEGMNQYDIWD